MRIVLHLCLFVFLLPAVSYCQLNYNFFVSNSGSDSNSGTSKLLPKRTITGIAGTLKNFGALNGRVSVGLESGSIFNESLAPAYPIQIGTYNDSAHKNDFAILNGTDVFDTGWNRTTGTSNTYQQTITSSGFSGAPAANNSYVYVVEINKELEKIAPFTARKLLQFVPTLQAVDKTPGSFYEPVTNDTSITVYVHTGNGISPNSNAQFRYEVAVRNRAVDGYENDNNSFENLWVRGYRAGYGLMPSGASTYCNKVVFGPGAGIHHIALKSGLINNSLFLPAAQNTSVFAVVFYDVEGFGRHNKISNSIFLDIPSPIYTHTSNGSNHGALELENVIAFEEGSQGGAFISTSDNDSLMLNNVYLDKYDYGYNVGHNNISAKYSAIKNCYFKDVANAFAFGSNAISTNISNVFVRSSEKTAAVAIAIGDNTSVNLANTIIHLKSGNGAFVSGSGGLLNHISATGNIFIFDADAGQSVTAASTNTNKGIGTSADKWNNNVYVLLKGNKIVWSVSNAASNNGSTRVETFEEWKRQSGQDRNSLFFDLRNDPRGLQAIFIDPDNGNYELANTVEGNKVKDLQAGMTTPISCFLKKPTYEKAADLIKNDKTLTLNSCRYSCQQTIVNINSTATDSNGVTDFCANEAQEFKGSTFYKENDNPYHQSDLTSRYLWWFSDGTDTSGVNLNTVDHRFSNDGSTKIRLQVVDENGCSFDSTLSAFLKPVPVVKLGTDTTLCKSLDIILSANYPGAKYLWNTGNRENSITVNDEGIYWVQTTLDGCSYRDSIKVKSQNCLCNIQLPNAFSPNGDGLNDVYKPVFGCYPTTYELSVFNRNGQLVFKTNDYNNYWDGLYNGKPLPVGAYVYMLNINNESLQKVKQMRGSIMLLR